jgi:hypothetical protein
VNRRNAQRQLQRSGFKAPHQARRQRVPWSESGAYVST